MTELLFHQHSYLQEFDATVTGVADAGVALDRTAFYIGGGGQPSDIGVLSAGGRDYAVSGVKRDSGLLVHLIHGDRPAEGSRISGRIDWERRYQLMRTHTALHILCGVVWRDYGALVTGGNMQPGEARMDFELERMSADFAEEVEAKINEEVAAARNVLVANLPREEAEEIPDLIRTKINLLPANIREVRTIDIQGLDVQATAAPTSTTPPRWAASASWATRARAASTNASASRWRIKSPLSGRGLGWALPSDSETDGGIKMTPALPTGSDPRAVDVARQLREAINAECVILFGSRARSDWREHSDVDLLIITGSEQTDGHIRATRETAREIIKKTYGKIVDFDNVFLTPAQYELKSRHTLNHVARAARKEGIFMSRNPDEYGPRPDEEESGDYHEESQERERRIADANMHYNSMQALLDNNIADISTANQAQQALEHAMKALISALGYVYPPTHDLTELAVKIEEITQEENIGYRSNLKEMGMYAGGRIYDRVTLPEAGYTRMANGLTSDMNFIYAWIEELTGENPWEVPTRLQNLTVTPRYRPSQQ